MTGSLPHPIPYQGSKRRLAKQILRFFPARLRTLYKPFAGSAAITVAVANQTIGDHYVILDSFGPLACLWQQINSNPNQLAQEYARIWHGQQRGDDSYYNGIRAAFNGDGDPVKLLYLLARCVKNAVRFNQAGAFNQAPDRRRLGTKPLRMEREIAGAAKILAGRVRIVCGDYARVIAQAEPEDFVYMDPPYHGTSEGRDHRYHEGITLDRFVATLVELNDRRVPFLVSFDGRSGARTAGTSQAAAFGAGSGPLHAGNAPRQGGRNSGIALRVALRKNVTAMGYVSLRECVDDLERTKQLVRIDVPIDPRLEAAEIQRRVFQVGGPALYFARVTGCAFPMVSNLFGTRARVRYLFRDAFEGVRALVDAKVDISRFLTRPQRTLALPGTAMHLLPKFVASGPVLARSTSVRDLPPLVSWPGDGGPFVTLPQVYSEDPDRPGVRHSNLGMYRVQLTGNDYVENREVGLHYQLHRGLGVHHTTAIRRGERLPVNVFVGGPPAMAVAAVMPLPEGLPELAFAGVLNGRRVRMIRQQSGAAIHADADVCIRGYIEGRETKPEGPFGDHLGYYAKVHDFPVLHVESVTHREGAIWPFTTVGRPPQEDTMFGELIHELTGPLVPTVIPGVRGVNAVDAAGVHPLLLAVGSERYTPYAEERRPQELLTQANAILGQGQMSLAKYLLLIADEGATTPDVKDIGAFFRYLLERFDPTRDLHFHTNTTMDTLDYTGTGLNQGSKMVMVAAGPKRRELATVVPTALPLPEGFSQPQLCLPGVLAVQGPAYEEHDKSAERLCHYVPVSELKRFPLMVLVDDSTFTARTLENFLWVTFTRSNPAVDVHGVESFVVHKAWGCRGPVVIDARGKPQHAPPLVEDPAVTRRVNEMAAPGGPLRGLF